MKYLIGIGNPGEKYANTRHNIGYQIVTKLAEKLHLKFEKDAILNAQIAKNDQVNLILPLTYVNKTGETVYTLATKFNLVSDDLWVVHDDADLPFSEVRIKQGGSSVGHHGIGSIDQNIDENYWRVRVGIGRDSMYAELSEFVLAPFNKDEQSVLPNVVDQVANHLVKSIEREEIKTESFDAKEKN